MTITLQEYNQVVIGFTTQVNLQKRNTDRLVQERDSALKDVEHYKKRLRTIELELTVLNSSLNGCKTLGEFKSVLAKNNEWMKTNPGSPII